MDDAPRKTAQEFELNQRDMDSQMRTVVSGCALDWVRAAVLPSVTEYELRPPGNYPALEGLAVR